MDEDVEADAMLRGTTDVQKAIDVGGGWIPPERPTPEGLGGEDARGSDRGEDH